MMKLIGPLSLLCLLASGCATEYRAKVITLPPSTPESRRELINRIFPRPIDRGDVFTRYLEGIDRAIVYRVQNDRAIPAGQDSRFLVSFIEKFRAEKLPPGVVAKKMGLPILDSRTVQGDSLSGLLSAWRSQTLGCSTWELSGCFSPRHVIRFYSREKMVLEAIICLSCGVAVLELLGGHHGSCSIDGFSGPVAQEIFRIIPEPDRTPVSGAASEDPGLFVSDASYWESPELNDVFPLAQRGRIAHFVRSALGSCHGPRDRTPIPRPAEAHITFTIPGTVESAPPGAAPHLTVLDETAVTDIALQLTPTNPELEACYRENAGLLRFLKSRRGPLRVRLRL